MHHVLAIILIIVCVGASSLRPAEERFAADQQVGGFEDDTLTVYVEDGLAAVSRTDTGHQLW